MFHVYLVSNKINGKIYIGYTSNPHIRWLQHKNPNHKYSGGNLLKKAIKKYGTGNFKFEILETFAIKNDALDAEVFWISYLKSLGAQLYNLTDGGESGSSVWKGKHLPQRMKDKMSISHTGKHKGTLNIMYGKNHTTESKMKVGAKNRKIGDDVVKQIKEMSTTENYTGKRLAEIFNISTAQISKIINGKQRNLLSSHANT